MKSKFALGQTLITPGALDRLHPEDVAKALTRHACGDWGELTEEDRHENEFSLDKPLRLFSKYRDRQGRAFYVITEADRSATTVLLPDEY